MEILFFYILSNRYHAERAISIITKLFPEDHLLLASSKRVKGKFEILCFEKHLSVEYNSSLLVVNYVRKHKLHIQWSVPDNKTHKKLYHKKC